MPQAAIALVPATHEALNALRLCKRLPVFALGAGVCRGRVHVVIRNDQLGTVARHTGIDDIRRHAGELLHGGGISKAATAAVIAQHAVQAEPVAVVLAVFTLQQVLAENQIVSAVGAGFGKNHTSERVTGDNHPALTCGAAQCVVYGFAVVQLERRERLRSQCVPHTPDHLDAKRLAQVSGDFAQRLIEPLARLPHRRAVNQITGLVAAGDVKIKIIAAYLRVRRHHPTGNHAGVINRHLDRLTANNVRGA